MRAAIARARMVMAGFLREGSQRADQMAAIDLDHRTGHVGRSVGREQQQRVVRFVWGQGGVLQHAGARLRDPARVQAGGSLSRQSRDRATGRPAQGHGTAAYPGPYSTLLSRLSAFARDVRAHAGAAVARLHGVFSRGDQHACPADDGSASARMRLLGPAGGARRSCGSTVRRRQRWGP